MPLLHVWQYYTSACVPASSTFFLSVGLSQSPAPQFSRGLYLPFLDQDPTSIATLLLRSSYKSQRLRRFKSDWDESCQYFSSSKYVSIAAVGFFDMASYCQDGGHDIIAVAG